MIKDILSITMYMHCQQCLNELNNLSENISPQEYSNLDVGWTKQGFQVWCFRHQINVCHMDLEGKQHPANIMANKNQPIPHKLKLV